MKICNRFKQIGIKQRYSVRNKAAILLAVCVFLTGSVLPVAAADTSQSYAFDVSVNGGENAAVEPGETVEVALSLSRTDDSGPMTIYAMSAVLRFNTNLMELEELTASSGVSSTVTELSGSLEGWSDVTLNYLAPSMSGIEWENGITLMTMKLKASRYGSSLIQTRRGSVSTYSGMDSYSSTLGNAVVSVQTTPKEEELDTPTEPATPTTPDDTTTPTTPENPTTPDKTTPTEPGGSTTPTTPASPAEPGGTTTPASPVQPEDPADPPETTQPDDSTAPVTPTVPDSPTTPDMDFIDVAPDAWYAAAVRYVTDKAYFNGTGAYTFSPEYTMTRAMFVTVLGRMAGVELSDSQETSFRDVPAGQWYSVYVQWASANGIVTGYDSEHFGPDDPVTREQMAAILYRFAQYSGNHPDAFDESLFQEFRDADQVSDYAKTPMIWATDKRLINGMGDGTLAPQKTATRAEVAQIVKNYAEKML